MRRSAECLVRKRDGRNEWLRATKLARSILLAVCEAEPVDVSPVLEVAERVLRAVRSRRAAGDAIPTASIAREVERVLTRCGLLAAARRYAAARFARAAAIAGTPGRTARFSGGFIGRG